MNTEACSTYLLKWASVCRTSCGYVLWSFQKHSQMMYASSPQDLKSNQAKQVLSPRPWQGQYPVYLL